MRIPCRRRSRSIHLAKCEQRWEQHPALGQLVLSPAWTGRFLDGEARHVDIERIGRILRVFIVGEEAAATHGFFSRKLLIAILGFAIGVAKAKKTGSRARQRQLIADCFFRGRHIVR